MSKSTRCEGMDQSPPRRGGDAQRERVPAEIPEPRSHVPVGQLGTKLSMRGDTLITSSTGTQRPALLWDLPQCCRRRAVPDVVPDVGCFRANALMASNQAVDSREVMAFPRRGRWLWLVPGALPTHCPFQVTAGHALLTLKKFPAAASEMGIDTGVSVHGSSWTPALGKAVLWSGLMAWVPEKGEGKDLGPPW